MFKDDGVHTGEASAGFVNYMQVYDTATIAAAIPEPAIWGMMIVGFGMAGGMMRYRRRSTTLSFT